MSREQLLAQLLPGGNEGVLRANLPALGTLGQSLIDVLDSQGELALHAAAVAPISTEWPAHRVLITGQATVLQAPVDLRLVLTLADGQVSQFYLLMRLPRGWRMAQSLRQLANCAGGIAFFDAFHCNNPVWVVCAGAPAITDETFGLHEQVFDDGLSLHAAGLRDALPPNILGPADLPAAPMMAGQPPNDFTARFDWAGPEPAVRLLCWWPPIADAAPGQRTITVGAAPVRRVGIGFHCAMVSLGAPGAMAAPAQAPSAASLWELQLHPDEPTITVVVQPASGAAPPIYTALFPEARTFKTAGASALGVFTGGIDPTRALPFTNGPRLGLAGLQFQPGVSLQADLVALDRISGLPSTREAIPGVLTLTQLQLSLLAQLQPPLQIDVTVSGRARIGGFWFALEVEPQRRVRGALISPHELDLQAFVTGLLGHPIGFPNLQLTLLEAYYSNDLAMNQVAYGLAVGGHIDLMSNGALLLEGVGFQIETTDGNTTRKQMSGTVSVLKTEIRVTAEHVLGDGWTFEGVAHPETGFDLSALMSDWAHGIGLSVPPGLPDCRLTGFGLRFGGQRKLMRAWGRSRLQPSGSAAAPWMSGVIDVLVDIGTTINPQTASREIDLALNWEHRAGDHVFQASLSHSHGGNQCALLWDGTGVEGSPPATLGLADLHHALHLDAVFSMPDGIVGSLFAFSLLRIDFSSDPRLIQLQALSSLGSGALEMNASFTREQSLISARWQGSTETDTLGLSNLLEAIGLTHLLGLPAGLGAGIFDFRSLSLSYLGGALSALHFVGVAGDAFYESVFLSVLKTAQGERAFVAGVVFKDHSDLSDLPGIRDVPGLQALVAMLSIQPIYLLYASAAVDSYLPPVPDDEASAAMRSQPSGTVSGKVSSKLSGKLSATSPSARYTLGQGATVAARLVFEHSANPIFNQISQLIGLKELDAKVTIGKGLNLLASIPGQLSLAGAGGKDLVLSKAFFGLGVTASGMPTFQVGGSAHFNLFGSFHDIEARLAVSEVAAAAMLHLTGFEVPSIHPLPGLHFKDDFWLEIGAQFEPPGLDIGFMGDFYIGLPEENNGKAVIVMELVEGVPNPLYVRFAIDKLTVWAMFEAMTGLEARLDEAQSALQALDGTGTSQALGLGGVTHEADHALGFLKQQYRNLKPIFDGVSLNDVAFHWADSLVILPDGSTATPGVGFRGTLKLFGWDLFAAFEFSTCSPTKLTAHLEMEPIKISHVITLSGDGKGVLAAEAKGLAEAWEQWQPETPTQGTSPLLKPQAVAAEYVVNPGGPVLIVSSEHPPYLHASLHVALFDLLHLDVTATVDDKGMAFELVTGIGSLVNLTLGCSLRTEGGLRFEAYGKLELHLRADLSFDLPVIGTIPIVLDAGLDGEVHLIVTDHSFSLVIDGCFVFDDNELHLPTLTLSVPFPSLGGLPATIVQHIKDEAAQIFGDLFGAIGKLGGEVVEFVEDGAKVVGEGLKEIGEETVKDVKLIGAAVGHAFSDLADGLGTATHELENQLGQAEADVSQAVEQITAETEHLVSALEHDAQQVLAQAEQAFTDMGHAVADEVDKIGTEILDIGHAAEHEVEQIAAAVAPVVMAILDTASQVAQDIETAAEEIAVGLEELAGEILGVAAVLAQGLEDAAKSVAHAFEDLGNQLNPFHWSW